MNQQGKRGQEERSGQDAGRPECDSGAGRKDVTGTTNVYPASGPLPEGDARLQPMGTWGQADRGPEGSQDSGQSEIIPPGKRAPGADTNATGNQNPGGRAQTSGGK